MAKPDDKITAIPSRELDLSSSSGASFGLEEIASADAVLECGPEKVPTGSNETLIAHSPVQDTELLNHYITSTCLTLSNRPTVRKTWQTVHFEGATSPAALIYATLTGCSLRSTIARLSYARLCKSRSCPSDAFRPSQCFIVRAKSKTAPASCSNNLSSCLSANSARQLRCAFCNIRHHFAPGLHLTNVDIR